MIILGIDPGTASLGYGIIEEKNQKLKSLGYGCLSTAKSLPEEKRLKILFQGLTGLTKKYRPDCLAIEQIFFFKNSKTVIQVAQARGVALLAAANQNLTVCEFTPLQAKQAISGYGLAQKYQVQKMVQLILHLPEMPKPDDAADALAIAICAANSLKHKLLTGKI